MIIFDNVYVKGFDGREYRLSFHIPTPSISMVVLPSNIDKYLLAEYIARIEEPVKGKVIYEEVMENVKPRIYVGQYVEDELVMIGDILSKVLDLGEYTRFERICKSLGVEIGPRTRMSDLPYHVRKLITILYTLYRSRGVSILIEPFNELDDVSLALIFQESRVLKEERKLTIIVLTNTKAFLEYGIYEYAVVIDIDGSIIEGDIEKFRGRDILVNTYTYEVRGDPSILASIVNIPGLKGFVEIKRGVYWIVVDQRFRWTFVSNVQKLVREKKINYLKFLGKQRLR